MSTIKADTENSMDKKSERSNELATNSLSRELLTTSLLAAVGTATLVGMHHGYRQRRQPDASLQDYVSGVRSQLNLSLLSKPRTAKLKLTNSKLARCRYAYQQAKVTWQQAYQQPVSTDAISHHHNVTDFSAIHTTTMLARPVCWVSGVASMPKNIVSAKNDSGDVNHNEHNINNEHSFGVVGIDADRQIVWQTTMPERVHDIVVQPVVSSQDETSHNNENRDVVVMGRRPSEKFWVLDTATGQVKLAIKASADRHFYGHACYSLDGSTLYVTENDTQTLDGKIGIYDTHRDYQKVAEFDSHGIGPHELIMHPDGDTLVIANGGIKTEQASREELNLDSMRPSLVYLNRHDGTLLEQVTPKHNQMSVRHLAMHNDGTVMVGIQFQGERHINVPLVLTHKRGDTDFKPLTMPNNQWQRFHQYIASVAVDSQRNLLCVTTPIGGCAAIYDLNTRTLVDAVSLPDCAGASIYANKTANDISNKAHESGFIVSDGQGQLSRLDVSDLAIPSSNVAANETIAKDSKRHMMSFDNHLQAL